MKKKSGPAAKTLASIAEAKDFIGTKEAVVVGFFKDAESTAAKVFLQAADGLDDYPCGISTSTEVLDNYAISDDTVVVFKTYDEPRTDLAVGPGTDADALLKEINAATMYLIETFSNDRARAIFSGPVQIHGLIFDNIESSSHSNLADQMKPVATEFKGKILFVWVPTTEARVFEYFGLKTTDVPKFIISDMSVEGKNLKYFYDGAMETPGVQDFTWDVLAGRVKPSLKSEDVAPADLEDPVKVVKGKSFEELVINNDKDVLLEFYAPWCGHCKSLAPVFDELGEKFEDVSSVVIAKMDATANEIDHPEVSVKGFPTIYFFPGNNKNKPVVYDGARDLEGFTKYLMQNAVNKFSLDGEAGGRASVAEEL
jgi:protein disulfide-isomerase A1